MVEECVEHEGSEVVGFFSTWGLMYDWVKIMYPEAMSSFSVTFGANATRPTIWRGSLGGNRYLEVRKHELDPEPLSGWILVGSVLHPDDCGAMVPISAYRFRASPENAAEVARLVGADRCVSCDNKEEK